MIHRTSRRVAHCSAGLALILLSDRNTIHFRPIRVEAFSSTSPRFHNQHHANHYQHSNSGFSSVHDFVRQGPITPNYVGGFAIYQLSALNWKRHGAISSERTHSLSDRIEPLRSFNNKDNYNDSEDPPLSDYGSSSSEEDEEDYSEQDFKLATASTLVLGQSGVALVAVGLAWIAKTPGFLGLGDHFTLLTMDAWKLGALAVLPLAVWAFALDLIEDSVPALQLVTKATQRSVLNLLGSQFLPITGFLVAIALGVAAGIGEEWLFRGFFQVELLNLFTDNVSNASWLAVVASSLVFGALHTVTPLYAALATLASLYFGFLYVWTDNLAVPMICHSLYDIAALYYAHWTVAKDLTPQQRSDLLRLPL